MSAPGLPRRRRSREAAALIRLGERSWSRVAGPYRALDLSFSVRMANDDLADYLEPLLAPFATDAAARHVYSMVDDGERYKNRYAVYFDGLHIIRTPDEPQALDYLLWHLNRAVVTESDRYLLIHAAVAARDGSAILLPAPMDSGKTTLVAGLVRRGFDYLTDEAAAIDPTTLVIDPYPKPLSIDSGSWTVLSDLRPPLERRFGRFAEERWHVMLDSVRAGAIAGSSPARLVISPRYEEGANTALEPMSRAAAVLLLAENAFNFGSHKRDALDTLAAVVRDCDCYRLTVGSLDAACDAVERVVAELRVGV